MRLAATPVRLFTLAVAGQFLFGVVLALPGTLFGLPGWTTALGVDVAAQARLLVMFFAGQFVFTAVAGTLVDRVGAQRMLAAGSLLMASGFVLLARATTSAAAIPPMALLACGGASINAASNTLVSATFGDRRGAMLSLMATFGASGSLAAPLLFAGGPGAGAVAIRLWALTLFALVVTLLPLLVVPAATPAAGTSLLASLRLLRERPLAGLITLLALEFGAEAVLAGWTAAYAIAVFPGTSGGLMIGLYWGGLLTGRLCAPLALARVPKLVLVLTGSLTTAGAIAAMATAPVPAVLAAAAFLAGFAVGPLAPTIVSVAGDRYPRQMGAAIGVLLSVAQIGGIAMPWLTGRMTIAYGYRAGLTVPSLAALGIAAGTLLAWQARARRVPAPVEAPIR